ncbi:MAG: hypothetical protein K1X55_11875 [Chitinophagales bacterium]|nr:hypothetical protein [Chitinophagales bacterium]
MPDSDAYMDDFFLEIKEVFPPLLQLSTWEEWKDDPIGKYIIMEDIATEMIIWVGKGDFKTTGRMLDFIEYHLRYGHPIVQNVIYTDFLPCIFEIEDGEQKAKVIGMFGPTTLNEYQNLEASIRR